MKDYKRLTNQPWSENIDLKEEYGYSHIYKRLYELENQIQNGTLVPQYSVVESCGTYYVCSVDTENLPIIDEYETEEEAQKKLEELENVK